MSIAVKRQSCISPEEYLAMERQADYKSEYFDGEIFAMAGASEKHNIIAGNIFAALHRQLRNRSCRVYMSDMRLNIQKTGLYTYPDIMVVCGNVQYEDRHEDTVLNPVVIFEVLSKSTAGYDKGEKFSHYRRLHSLQEYILAAQKSMRIEHYVRQPNNQWLLSEFENPQHDLFLPSIDCHLLLTNMYEKVEFIEKI